MRHTELIRLVFDQPDGSAKYTFTNIFFPVKQITITNAYYSSQIDQTTPAIIAAVESNMAGNRRPLIITPINSYNTTPSTLYLDNAVEIIGTKSFYLNNIGCGQNQFGPYGSDDTVCMLVEFYGFDIVNPMIVNHQK